MIDRITDQAAVRPLPQTIVIPGPSPTPGVARGNGQIFSLNDVTFVLRRWWWRCALFGLPLSAAACAAVWFTFIPVYQSTALLEIKRNTPHVIFPTDTSGVFAQTQLEIIRSPIVLAKVVTEPEIAKLPEVQAADSPIQWLQQGLRAGYIGQSELCQIAFTARNPETSAVVANAILDAYLDLYRDKTMEHAEKIQKVLGNESNRRMLEIQRLKDKVRMLYKEQTGAELFVDAAGNEMGAVRSPLSGLEERRIAAEVERVMEEAKLNAYQDAIAAESGEVSAEELTQALQDHPEVQVLKANVTTAQTIARLREQQMPPPGKRNPNIQAQLDKYLQDVRQSEASLAAAMNALRPKVEAEMKQAASQRNENLLQETKARIENHKLVEDVWSKRIEEERKSLDEHGGGSLELEFARNDLARAEDVLQKIRDRVMILDTEQRAPAQADLMQRAVASDYPVEAVPIKKCGMAACGAFFVPFLLAFGWERLLRRISSAEQLVSEISLPVLGEVTTLPTRWMLPGRRTNERFIRDRITFEESIESLRLGVTLSPELKHLQTIAVTSAVSQEGKTSVATALAVSVARCSQDLTLLIDADMRAPNVHEMFGVSLSPGLAEVLDGTVSLEDAIVSDGLGVHVLPAGDLKVNPHVAMKDGAFAKVLDQLRSKYRYIIVDAPPVLAASEAVLISSVVDGSLVCTMRDRSRFSQLNAACQRLLTAGARLVGSVISGVPTRDWAQKYGSYGYGWDRYREANAKWNAPSSSSSREMIIEASGAHSIDSEDA